MNIELTDHEKDLLIEALLSQAYEYEQYLEKVWESGNFVRPGEPDPKTIEDQLKQNDKLRERIESLT